ncbi:MAG: hypothetical protein LBN36_05700 [Clostridiales Family XIII bacterium]|jgi:hypothetical protein|nr:hypothetical protein [Clostridiales Family XIII bacterium]
MQSTASSANSARTGAVIRENLRRFWPLTLVFFLAMFLTSVFQAILSLVTSDSGAAVWKNHILSVLSGAHPMLILVSFILPVVAAVSVFKYLNQTSAVSVMHAMPFSRRQLFSSNFFSGLILSLAPVLALALTILPFVIGQRFHLISSEPEVVGVLLWFTWLISIVVVVCFTYALSVFACIITGTTVMNILIACLLNFIVIFLYLLSIAYLDTFLLGFQSSGDSLDLAIYMHPLILSATSGALHFLQIVLYLIASGVVALLAFLLYRVLKTERAGDSVTFRVAGMLLIYIVTLLGMSGIGILFFLGFGEFALYVGAFLGALLTFIIITMIVRKTPKVFNMDALKHFGIFVIIGAVFMVCTTTDITGYEHRVPNPGAIRSVEVDFIHYPFLIPYEKYHVSDVQMVFTDPDSIGHVIALHEALIPAERRYREKHMPGAATSEDPYPLYDDKDALLSQQWSGGLYLRYEKTGLFRMNRTYDDMYRDGQFLMELPDVKALAETSEFKDAYSLENRIGYDHIANINLAASDSGGRANVAFFELMLQPDNMRELLRCMDKDFKALSFEDMNDLDAKRFTLELEYEVSYGGRYESYHYTNNIYYRITDQYTETIAWFKAHDLYDNLLSNNE